jgi:hypothetical protein
MKRWLAIALLIVVAASFCFAGKPKPQKFTGEIADTQCALNVHSLSRSHTEMLAKDPSIGGDAAACTRYCVEHGGGEYVLTSGPKVYRFTNAEKAADFAGQQVIIYGTLDAAGKVLTIDSIKAKPSKPAKSKTK